MSVQTVFILLITVLSGLILVTRCDKIEFFENDKRVYCYEVFQADVTQKAAQEKDYKFVAQLFRRYICNAANKCVMELPMPYGKTSTKVRGFRSIHCTTHEPLLLMLMQYLRLPAKKDFVPTVFVPEAYKNHYLGRVCNLMARGQIGSCTGIQNVYRLKKGTDIMLSRLPTKPGYVKQYTMGSIAVTKGQCGATIPLYRLVNDQNKYVVQVNTKGPPGFKLDNGGKPLGYCWQSQFPPPSDLVLMRQYFELPGGTNYVPTISYAEAKKNKDLKGVCFLVKGGQEGNCPFVIPVYRLKKGGKDSDHMLSTDANEGKDKGYVSQGSLGFLAVEKGHCGANTPLYRKWKGNNHVIQVVTEGPADGFKFDYGGKPMGWCWTYPKPPK